MLSLLGALGRRMMGILYGALNDEERARYLCEHPDEFAEKLTALLLGEAPPGFSGIAKAAVFYKRHFGLAKDFSSLHVPRKPPGDYWLLVVAEGLTPMRVFARWQELGWGCWKSRDDLDSFIPKSDRKSDKDYAVWVKATQEADEDLKKKSYEDLGDLGIFGNTLLERMLLEIQYNDETGDHLDKINATLCSGSRYPDGRVPFIYWDVEGRGLCIFGCGPRDCSDGLRSRAVVSS